MHQLFNKKTLILSPHLDDACLGMGGSIEVVIHNPNIYIVLYTDYEHPGLSEKEQIEYANEAIQFSKDISMSNHYNVLYLNYTINQLESEKIEEQIRGLECIINNLLPHNIFIPHKDYNQDHRRVYDIAAVATRAHDKNWYIPNVFTYEQVCTVQSQTTYEKFSPHVFVPIDIEKKLALWDIFKTQHRGHRTPDMIRALAAVRGMQCNAPYAEAFQVIRMTQQ